MKEKINTLIFDVNETLLDLEPLKKSINSALKDQNAAEVWFAQLLHYSLVESITNVYHDFSEIGAAVLKMNAQKHSLNLSDQEIKKILSPIKTLHPYPEVEFGLKQLRDSGYQMVAFSNGKPSVLKKQLEFSQLEQYFDHILSVEGVKKYKPHLDSYHYALKKVGASPENTMMVAAHGWDITGAARAGLQTAFIARKGKFAFPLAPEPSIITTNIKTLAAELSTEDSLKNKKKPR